MNKLVEFLNNPSKEERPIPFWSWNDELDPQLLSAQIREMEKAGLGGYFMHARGGLETEYLGEDWMQCVKACIEEGKRTGMGSWIYDEDGWPSGFAAGKVTALGDRFHGRWLQFGEYGGDRAELNHPWFIGLYMYEPSNDKYMRIAVAEADSLHGAGRKLLLVKHASNPHYIDVMSREAVRAFIDCTHESYYKYFEEDFKSGAVKGFFTDEPRLTGSLEGDVPWSYGIPESFMRKYGYDLPDVLPALAFACSGCEKVRYDFWELVGELFVANFMQQINDWCAAHNCSLTGHLMMEESLFTQMTGTGGVMPFYEHMGMPGIDWLRRMISSPIVPKQVGSAAAQLGKKAVISESFALCGWSVSFEELKWIAEWQYVNGVNILCQHLEGYTLRGLRKRDYPPSLFTQQSWWKEYSHFNDYFARLGRLLASGDSRVEVLVLHPMRSGWITYDGSRNEAVKKLDAEFIRAVETLSGLHIDYHLGDETLIRRHGSVEKDRFVIGRCSYRAVVLPSMKVLDSHTLELLLQFAANGGVILSVGEFPFLCSGLPEERLLSLRSKTLQVGDNRRLLLKIFDKLGFVPVSIAENGEEVEQIHFTRRIIDGTLAVYMVNHNQERTFHTQVALRDTGNVVLYNAGTGETEELEYACTSEGIKTKLTFLPMQSHILLVEDVRWPDSCGSVYEADAAGCRCEADAAKPDDAEGAENTQNTQNTQNCVERGSLDVIQPGTDWRIEAVGFNSLTLDYCTYNIDYTGWKGPIPVIHLMKKLLALQRSCYISLGFTFDVEMDLAANREFFLAIEKAGEFKIEVNGKRLEYSTGGWWKDSSFEKVDIKPYVVAGRNEVVLSRRFHQSQKVYNVLFGQDVYETEKNKLTYDVELESIYVVGDFGVRSKSGYTAGGRKSLKTDGPFVITGLPEQVTTGDLTQQGFCFFADVIRLGQKLYIHRKRAGKLLLDIGRPDAVLAKVYLNGRFVKHLCWAPFEADLTDFAVEGVNTLELELFSGNRNLLGPHHHIGGDPHNVGPSSFSGEWSWVEKSTEAVPAASGDRRRNYWTDSYGFVKFGLNAE